MRDYRNDFIQMVKIELSDKFNQTEMDEIVATVSGLLDQYEITERSTELVPLDDKNMKLLKTYANCILVDGKSKGTVAAYLRELQKFVEFTGNKDLLEITSFDIRNYLAQEKIRGISNRTIENSRANLSAFFTWLTLEEYVQKNPCLPIKPIKYAEEVKEGFSLVELDKLRGNCKTEKERAIIEVLISSGVRVSELVNLNVDDVDFNKKVIHVRHGKGDKDRYTYINDVAQAHLIKYLTENNIISGALFRSQRKGRYTTHGIRQLLSALAKRAGVDNVHPHRFRRTFATMLASRGMNIQDIQSLMGHTDINTTMIYVALDDATVNNSYRKYAV